jgi:glycosyltransferase involved in cell wall biosynthesis
MKVAFLLGSLNRGGTETLLLDLFRNSKSQGLDAIGIYRKSGVLENNFRESGLPLYKLSTKKNPIYYILLLRKLLLENDVTIAHAQQPIDALYAWLACIGTPLKVLLTLHGYDFSENIYGNQIIRFIVRRTNTNIYVSDTQREHYQEKYHLKPDKQKVVYNGISFDKLDGFNTLITTKSHIPSNDAPTLRDELQLSPSTLLLGAVGNFNGVRDQMITCRFLKLLQVQKVDFHFVFVGKRIGNTARLYDDCLDFCITNGLSDSASFLGVRNDVPMILNELDAFVYATNHDTFGIAVVEAMAVGIPVFVNDWGVMSEITGNGKYATIYKTKDENDLLQHFMLFLQNKPVYQEKARHASLFVRERYSIEKHIEALKEVYNKMINTD